MTLNRVYHPRTWGLLLCNEGGLYVRKHFFNFKKNRRYK
jgi:hypothetical protein